MQTALDRNETPSQARTPVRIIGSFASLRTLCTTLIVAMGIAGFMGCGSKNADRLPVFPVEGQITLNGQPLAHAFVVLHPKGNGDPRLLPARAQTDRNGNFQVTTYEAADGAAAGEYAVTIEHHPLIGNGNSFEPGPNVLPPKYASPETTDVTVSVAERPNRPPPIDVRR
jgi:hypothetical protein